MPKFPWPEYLNLSRNIVQNIQAFNNQESVHRCAVSRAYYSAFCSARNYARDFQNFKPTERGRDHSLVIDHFKNNGMVDIAFKLLDLKGWREKSDYQDNSMNNNINKMTTDAFTRADYILNRISTLIP